MHYILVQRKLNAICRYKYVTSRGKGGNICVPKILARMTQQINRKNTNTKDRIPRFSCYELQRMNNVAVSDLYVKES